MSEQSDRFKQELVNRRLVPATVYRYVRIAEDYGSRSFTRDALLGYLGMLNEKSPAYVRFVAHALKMYAQSQGLQWPLAKYDVPRIGSQKRPFLLQAQAEKLIELSSRIPMHNALIRVAVISGCRREELTRILVADYRRPSLRIRTAKGGEERTITLDEPTCDAVEKWLRTRPRNSSYMFCSYRDNISTQTLSNIFTTYARAAGFPKGVGWHAVRRGLVTMLYKGGMGIREIQSYGGWKTPEMAARYIQLVPGEADAAAQRANPLFRKSKQAAK